MAYILALEVRFWEFESPLAYLNSYSIRDNLALLIRRGSVNIIILDSLLDLDDRIAVLIAGMRELVIGAAVTRKHVLRHWWFESISQHLNLNEGVSLPPGVVC